MANIFDFIKGFSRTEKNMNEPDKLDPKMLMVMHFLRGYIRSIDPNATISLHVTVATKGHSKTSQHYLPRACAMDFHVNTTIPYEALIDIILGFLKAFGLDDRVGLGLYPQWNNKGFHLDTRGFMARWGYLGKGNDQYKVSFEEAYTFAKAA
jgi:uncharacterized protein YcbK (DUF882 family)